MDAKSNGRTFHCVFLMTHIKILSAFAILEIASNLGTRL